MTSKHRVSGKELDQLIESELLSMEREGLDRAPIKASTLHARLKAKDLVTGRRTGAAYIKKAARMESERDIWQKKYQDNLFAVLDLVKEIQVNTPIKIEDILSPFLIRELRITPKKYMILIYCMAFTL